MRRAGEDNDLNDLIAPFPPLAAAALDTKNRTSTPAAGEDVGETRGAFPEPTRRSRTRRRSSPSAGPTRPTCSAGSTTSRPPAATTRSAASRARSVFNAFTCRAPAPGIVPLPSARELLQAAARTGQYKRCPGAAEEPAADGSNVFSADEQKAARLPRGRPRDGDRRDARARSRPRDRWRACAVGVRDDRAPSDDERRAARLKIQFDNAFGLTEGGDLASAASRPARPAVRGR